MNKASWFSAQPHCKISLPVRWRRSMILQIGAASKSLRRISQGARGVICSHFNRPVSTSRSIVRLTDATYSRSLAQTNSLGIRQGSLLSGNRMVAPGRRHASLIPSHSFTRRITASVQYRGNLVVAVANSHTTNDLQRLRRRGGLRCRTRPLHRELRMRASLPVNHQLKAPFLLVGLHNDLFDGCAKDHLLERRRTVVTLPHLCKVLTHRTYCDFLFRR